MGKMKRGKAAIGVVVWALNRHAVAAFQRLCCLAWGGVRRGKAAIGVVLWAVAAVGEIVLSADPARAVYVQSPMHGVHTWPKVLVWTPETLRASQSERTLACLAVCTSVRTVTP